jgi:hypothetical protein
LLAAAAGLLAASGNEAGSRRHAAWLFRRGRFTGGERVPGGPVSGGSPRAAGEFLASFATHRHDPADATTSGKCGRPAPA